MTRTTPQAMEWYRDHMRWPAGLCLQWSRMGYDVDPLYPDASTAWQEAKFKHRTESGIHVPRGGLAYWTGGSRGFGHIAPGAGDGWCLSTDAGGAGVCARVRIDDLTRWWDLNFQGWAEDVNGVRVYNVAPPDKPAAGWDRVSLGALDRGESNADIERVKWALRKKVGLGDMDLEGKYKQHWGRATTEQYGKWQQRIGFSGSDADGRPGETSLRHLGRSAGFEVAA